MPKYGDRREDGRIFFCLQKHKLKDGSIAVYECWLNPCAFNRQMEARKAFNKKWKQKNKERQREYYRKYRNGNGRIKRIEFLKTYRKKNKEKVNGHTYKWRKNNPGKMAQQRFLRRTKNEQVELTDKEKMLVNQIYKFAKLCQETLGIKYHVDHVIPVSLGGSNHPSNLRVIPAEMNLKKGNKLNEATLD